MEAKANLKTGDLSGLRKTLAEKNDKDYRDGDVWQAILNLGYSKWQNRNTPTWRYGDMVNWVRLEYGDFACVCVLMGKYNYQVTNGGHMQYWDNGYAGGRPGRPDDDHSLHRLMLNIMEDVGVIQLEYGQKVYDVMRRFKVLEFEEEFYDHHDDVYYAQGDHRLEDAMIDDDYYKISDEWMREFGEVVRVVVKGQ